MSIGLLVELIIITNDALCIAINVVIVIAVVLLIIFLKPGQYKLTMLGVIVIMDPPKQDAIDTIKIAHTAGIVVKMITDDHSHTEAFIY